MDGERGAESLPDLHHSLAAFTPAHATASSGWTKSFTVQLFKNCGR